MKIMQTLVLLVLAINAISGSAFVMSEPPVNQAAMVHCWKSSTGDTCNVPGAEYSAPAIIPVGFTQ